MAHEFTQRASHWITAYVLRSRVKCRGSVFSAGRIWFASNHFKSGLLVKQRIIPWKVCQISLSPTLLGAPSVHKQGPIWPRPCVYWDSCSDDLGPQQVPWIFWTSGGAELLRSVAPETVVCFLLPKLHLKSVSTPRSRRGERARGWRGPRADVAFGYIQCLHTVQLVQLHPGASSTGERQGAVGLGFQLCAHVCGFVCVVSSSSSPPPPISPSRE